MLFQEEYYREMKSAEEVLRGKMFAVLEKLSEESIDKSIAYWESPEGKEFSAVLSALSELINSNLIEACGRSARKIVDKISIQNAESKLKHIFAFEIFGEMPATP